MEEEKEEEEDGDDGDDEDDGGGMERRTRISCCVMAWMSGVVNGRGMCMGCLTGIGCELRSRRRS